MGAFQWISVTLAMVLGLGVTRVLSGAIAVFRSRTHAELDWVPLVWASAIFVLQIQYWWAVLELPSLIVTWTLPAFLLLLGIPLILFTAAALILPAGELDRGTSLRELFQRDGRWALACLSVYAVLAMAVNAILFGETLFSRGGAVLAVESALPLVFLLSPSRRLKALTTILYLVLVTWSSWLVSPKSY